MGGKAANKEILNNTLHKIAILLNNSSVDKWFISYGTLLGIVRDDSCIDYDDDIDICICTTHYDAVSQLLTSGGFEIWNETYPYDRRLKGSTKMIKTKPTEELASMDLYFCRVDDTGMYFDMWETAKWHNCLDSDGKLLTKEWNGTVLNIPNNFEQKLAARYGEWQVPKKMKCGGPSPQILP